jgi:7,8-dihydropterin-6-yl-methyl-4-(beta-D-ribofuranosyl)aminobenzene 5'-phosphate synthase
MKRIPVIAALILSLMLLPLAVIQTDAERPAQNNKAEQVKSERRVRSLRVLVLSTMLAGNPGEGGIGEWGYAALVEADGHRILFDTGARPDTVINNARELGVNLSDVQDVVLSHNHFDHTSGLLTLRRELSKNNPAALRRVHVGKGIFWSRPSNSGDDNPMVVVRPAYEATGGVFVEHNEPAEIAPGVWFTGPVPRVYPERNWSVSGRVKTPDGVVEDTVPEDASLVFNTEKGIVLLSGCGHAGIINTLEVARKLIKPAPVYAAVGGFHLFQLDNERLDWTATKLKEFGLKHLLGGHCTGIEAVYRLRQQVGLDRRTCTVSAVGSSFTLDRGIDPLLLAR